MRIGLVGCGLIGSRRARAAVNAGDAVVVAADIRPAAAAAVREDTGCAVTTDWRDVVEADVDAIVVATVNSELMPIGVSALQARKHVLCEKPLGRNADEAHRLVNAGRNARVVLKTGFNHRHHPAVAKAHALARAGAIGPLLGL